MIRDTVITGIGVMAPNGQGTDGYWSATLAGESGIGPISRFDPSSYPVRLAGEIRGFEPEEHVSGRLMPQTDHMTRLALAAADLALADAELEPDSIDEYDRGVATASTSGGLEFGQQELEKLWGKGWEHVSAYMSFAWYYAVNTGQISIRHGMRGPGGVLVTEQTGGLDALGYTRRQLGKGTSLMVTGGVDGSLCPYGLAIQIANQRLSTEQDPALAYLPFDAEASGYVPGEGGAILTVEKRADAEARGAPRMYGVIAGYGAAFDPDPGGSGGLLRAARTAMADAGLTAADIGVVFADAAGLTELDRAEADAITTLFGPRGVPVAAPKTMTGRLLSGGGALDVAAALLCLRDRLVPPAANVREERIDERVDLVAGRPRSVAADAVLVLARGYGGFASAVVLTRAGGSES
jgi:act minimal PKS chain-length factor (CLF/KS beta)